MLDYSTIIMRIERKMKELESNCLHKRYEGFYRDIAAIHADLTLLGMWAVGQEAKEIFDSVVEQE